MNATLSFTNFPSNGTREFATVADAVAAGKRAGFEFCVWENGTLVASWTVFGGLRTFESEVRPTSGAFVGHRHRLAIQRAGSAA
jgi:hypothetical protein